MTETAKILKKARALIAKGWCRGAYAKTKTGRRTSRLDKDACRFCSLGAIHRAIGPRGKAGQFERATDALLGVIGDKAIPSWNDSQTNKRPVLRAFDRAIAAAEKSDA